MGNVSVIANTDSFMYIIYIECDDVYDIIKRDIAKFDTSDYPTDNSYGIPLRWVCDLYSAVHRSQESFTFYYLASNPKLFDSYRTIQEWLSNCCRSGKEWL